MKIFRLISMTLAVVFFGCTPASSESGNRQHFLLATSNHFQHAFESCEAAKVGNAFNESKFIELGWQELNRKSGVMFGKKPNGASITIQKDEKGEKGACIIIGWAFDQSKAEEARTLIAQKINLDLKFENPSYAKASKGEWSYTFMLFKNPEITDQIRLIIAIIPKEELN